MDLFKIQSKTLHTTEVRLTRQKLAKTSGSPNVNIGQITAAFHSPVTTAVARELFNKSAKGSSREVANDLTNISCSYSEPGLFGLSSVESLLWTKQGVTIRECPSTPMELAVLG